MPNSIETYGVISAVWTSSVAFGSFIGPTVSGYLYDQFQFRKASIFIVGLISIMVSWNNISMNKFKNSYKSI